MMMMMRRRMRVVVVINRKSSSSEPKASCFIPPQRAAGELRPSLGLSLGLSRFLRAFHRSFRASRSVGGLNAPGRGPLEGSSDERGSTRWMDDTTLLMMDENVSRYCPVFWGKALRRFARPAGVRPTNLRTSKKSGACGNGTDQKSPPDTVKWSVCMVETPCRRPRSGRDSSADDGDAMRVVESGPSQFDATRQRRASDGALSD